MTNTPEPPATIFASAASEAMRQADQRRADQLAGRRPISQGDVAELLALETNPACPTCGVIPLQHAPPESDVPHPLAEALDRAAALGSYPEHPEQPAGHALLPEVEDLIAADQDPGPVRAERGPVSFHAEGISPEPLVEARSKFAELTEFMHQTAEANNLCGVYDAALAEWNRQQDDPSWLVEPRTYDLTGTITIQYTATFRRRQDERASRPEESIRDAIVSFVNTSAWDNPIVRINAT